MFDQLPYGWTQWTRQSSNDPFISLSEGILVGYGTTDKNVPYLAEYDTDGNQLWLPVGVVLPRTPGLMPHGK